MRNDSKAYKDIYKISFKRKALELLKNATWFTILKWLPDQENSRIFKKLSNLNKKKSGPIKNYKDEVGLGVLFFVTRQNPSHIGWMFELAKALELRGVEYKYFGCDRVLQKSCNERWYPKNESYACDRCFQFAKKFYKHGLIPAIWVSKFVDSSDFLLAKKIIDNLDFDQYIEANYKGYKIGELVRPSVNHFLRVDNIEKHAIKEPKFKDIYRDFLINSIVMIEASFRILEKYKPTTIIMINGMFMAERIMLEIAKDKGINVIVLESGLLPDSFSIVRDTYINYGKIDGWEKAKKIDLSREKLSKTKSYIDKRITGEGQTLDYFNKQLNDTEKIVQKYGLKDYSGVAVLFPNVTWDSALYGLNIMYANLEEWIVDTISFFQKHKDYCLIVRSHPADVVFEGGMRDSVYRFLTVDYGRPLPKNIILIPPELNLSSYALMDVADLGLVFSSTTGLEMTLRDKPVITVGKVHYRGKGFTIDPLTRKQYLYDINRILSAKNKIKCSNVDLAWRYAYFIFFESSFKLKGITTNNYRTKPQILYKSMDELNEGNDSELDTLIERIVHGGEFYW